MTSRFHDPLLIVRLGDLRESASRRSSRACSPVDPQLRLSVSLTTRPPRSGEVHGREYVFVDLDAFERCRQRQELLESAEVHGNLYGTPRSALAANRRAEVDTLLDVDYQGGLAIKRELPEAVSIFILPPSFSRLARRLRGRATEGETQVARRLEIAYREMAHAVQYELCCGQPRDRPHLRGGGGDHHRRASPGQPHPPRAAGRHHQPGPGGGRTRTA